MAHSAFLSGLASTRPAVFYRYPFLSLYGPRGGSGKGAWTQEDVEKVVESMKATLPVQIVDLWQSGEEWKGGSLVQLSSELARPGSEDVVLNFIWIKPFVLHYPDSVPSAYFAGDVFMELDRQFEKNILIPRVQGDTKRTLALEEGARVKRCIGGLRYLWRSSALAALSCFKFPSELR